MQPGSVASGLVATDDRRRRLEAKTSLRLRDFLGHTGEIAGMDLDPPRGLAQTDGESQQPLRPTEFERDVQGRRRIRTILDTSRHGKPPREEILTHQFLLSTARLTHSIEPRAVAVAAASPSLGVNTVTGEGLAQALAGAQVVVDVANAPAWEDSAVLAFFESSGRNLLAAEAAAGVGHHVALSVVGTDRLLASGYFRAKMAQEKLIKASPIPYTIVRATQFFEFVGGIAQSATEGQTVRLPPVLMQPIVSDDVAAVMADAAFAEPLDGTVDLAGPEAIRQDDHVRRFLKATGDARTVITDPKALYYGIAVNDQSLMPGDNPRLGPTRFADWLSRNAKN